jgi:hypothetical protein
MSGCGWDLKYFGDLCSFMKEFGVGPVHFRNWFAAHNEEDPTWVVIEKQSGETVWSWFHKGLQVGEWVPVGEPCPVTKKLIPTKNGYFKVVPIEE